MEDLVKETEQLTIGNDSVSKDDQKSISEVVDEKEVKKNQIKGVGKITEIDKNEENMKVVNDTEKVEVAKDVENMEIAKDSENLKVTKDEENLKVTKDEENVDVAKDAENVEVAKDAKKVEISQDVENMEIAKDSKNMEVAKNEENVEVAKEVFKEVVKEVVSFVEQAVEDREKVVEFIGDKKEIVVDKSVEENIEEEEVEEEEKEEEADEEVDEDVETVSYNDGDVEDDTNVSDEEREDGDGQEEECSAVTNSKPIDDDVDKRNPQYIPKKGNFYEHDNRADNEKNAENEEKKVEKSGGKHEKRNVADKWTHDCYDENEQSPKSKSELVSKYGYDIRNEECPPKSRRRRRYTRGQTKYTRNWADENAYAKPQQSLLTSKRLTLRPYRSTKTTIRQRTRSREQKNIVVKSTTTATTTTTTANTTTDDEIRKKDDLEPEVNRKDDTEYQAEPPQTEPLVQQSQPLAHVEKKAVEKRKVFYKTSTNVPTQNSYRTRHSSFGSNFNNKLSHNYPQHAYNRSLRMKDELSRLRNANNNQIFRSRQSGDNYEYTGSVFVGRNSGFNRSQKNNFSGNNGSGYNNRNVQSQSHYYQQNRRSCYITSDEFDSQQTTTSNSSNDYAKKSSMGIEEQKPNVKRYSSMRQKSAPDLQTGSPRPNNQDSTNEQAESSERYCGPGENPVPTVVFVVKSSPRENNRRNNEFYNNSNNNSYLGGYRANNNRGYNRNHDYNHRRTSQQQYVVPQQAQQPAFIQPPSATSQPYFTTGPPPTQILNFSTPPPPPNHAMYAVPAPQQPYSGFTAPHHQFNQNSQPTPDIYQTQQGGITYYAPQTQMYTIPSHQKRPKAAIPIVSPSEVQQQMILSSNPIPFIANEEVQLQPQSVQEVLEDDDQSDIELYPISVVSTEEATIVVNQYLTTLSTSTAAPLTNKRTVASKDESREFMAIFPDIVRDLTDVGRHTDIPEVTKWYAKVLQYNVPTGKKNRGLTLVMAYKMIEKPENLTPDNLRLAMILGWCVEMLQAQFLILDDIMDGSELRRGVPCWYKVKNVGLSAINDALMIEKGIYSLLRRYFKDHPAYVPMIELINDVSMKTLMGQRLDLASDNKKVVDLNLFTMDRYNSIVKYKTSYYSCQLPVALAMYLSNNFDAEMHRQAKTILLEMGHFFQVQDDFLDCFGDPSIIGKDGTDIREGKCTWLAVVALQRCSVSQRQTMMEHYGVPSTDSVNKIRNLYEELGLPNMYAIYEEESYNLIHTHIQQISRGLPHALFFKFMEKVYRREC